MLQIGWIWISHDEAELKRQFIEWKLTTDSLIKKKFVVKKIMLRVFWGKKTSIIIDFFEKYTTVNSGFYCQLLRENSPYLLNDLHVSACVCVCVYINLLVDLLILKYLHFLLFEQTKKEKKIIVLETIHILTHKLSLCKQRECLLGLNLITV